MYFFCDIQVIVFFCLHSSMPHFPNLGGRITYLRIHSFIASDSRRPGRSFPDKKSHWHSRLDRRPPLLYPVTLTVSFDSQTRPSMQSEKAGVIGAEVALRGLEKAFQSLFNKSLTI